MSFRWLVVLALWVGSNAFAQPGTVDAKQRFARGQELVVQGRYAQALDEFEIGYQLSHRPLFLFNIAECARHSGNLPRARESYERYLQEDPAGSMAATARGRLNELGPATPAPVPVPAPAPREVVAPPPATRAPATAIVAPSAPLLVVAPQPRETTRKQRWPIWLGVGAAVAVVSVVAISVGVVYGGRGGGSCGGDCSLLDLRH